MFKTIYDGTRELKLVECRKPTPDAGEVLIKVDSATICGTDLHILDGSQPAVSGVSLGHEFSGYVESIGPDVYACKPGDLVTVEPHKFCGVCKYCRIGRVQQCFNKLAYGVHLDGGFEQYAVVPQQTVYPVPAGISSEEAALCETLGCCLHGIERAQIRAGDKVLILGGGVIGILLGKLAKLHGAASVIVSEPLAHRRRAMLEYCADAAVDPLHEDLEAFVAKYTDGLGPDAVIEAAGRPDTARQAAALAGRCGRILFFGIVPPEQTIDISPNTVFKKELTIVGSAINPYTHHRVLQLLPVLGVRPLVTHCFPLVRINEAMQAARQGLGLKICIKPNWEE